MTGVVYQQVAGECDCFILWRDRERERERERMHDIYVYNIYIF